MSSQLVQNNISASADTEFSVPYIESGDYGVAQVEITNTATVNLQGKLHTDMPWVTIKAFTASGAERFTVMPLMRFNTTITSGNVRAAVAS